ncbi:class III lanthipeptide [Idiomarina xiamenensis]|uniref:class III lanthipeptide n=1 Tax=Idiomarina xiamenensis TaxID=1207041 RepID=UPI000314C277|nr:class III lanthipeptide [Idiomarina xiamenensis]
MNRVLNLQTMAFETDASADVAAGSSCSWAACGGCSTASAASCSSEEQLKAI